MANKRTPNVCSFCGKGRDRVQRLIAGPGGIFICDECVRLCNEIIAEGPRPPSTQQIPVHPSCARGQSATWWRRLLPRRSQLAV